MTDNAKLNDANGINRCQMYSCQLIYNLPHTYPEFLNSVILQIL